MFCGLFAGNVWKHPTDCRIYVKGLISVPERGDWQQSSKWDGEHNQGEPFNMETVFGRKLVTARRSIYVCLAVGISNVLSWDVHIARQKNAVDKTHAERNGPDLYTPAPWPGGRNMYSSRWTWLYEQARIPRECMGRGHEVRESTVLQMASRPTSTKVLKYGEWNSSVWSYPENVSPLLNHRRGKSLQGPVCYCLSSSH